MIETFFTKLKSLSTGQRTVLKRCAGIMLTGADARALAVFYRILPPGVPQWQEPSGLLRPASPAFGTPLRQRGGMWSSFYLT